MKCAETNKNVPGSMPDGYRFTGPHSAGLIDARLI
ncbi:hypothetical protein Vsou_06940 [Vulcanisaeta souniana JCM 11219]|uniref:Uncharacterized protein n=1 Tax=Vulcanisaeta souniana JCM 11219 TaxID=1293586 RepID=A0ABM8BKU5_9CREN|nr:hypothetical protein Vsou_06940 [Vulcanisaeta souniana JCM 11219]